MPSRADRAVAALNAALARSGEPITLRRQLTGNPATYADVQVRAVVRGYDAEELVGSIAQTDSKVIISPSEILAAAWPAPPRRGDKAIIQGRTRNIEAVGPIAIGEQVVRYEMRVLG